MQRDDAAVANFIGDCVLGEEADGARVTEHGSLHALDAAGGMYVRAGKAVLFEIAANEKMKIAGGVADVECILGECIAADGCCRSACERM